MRKVLLVVSTSSSSSWSSLSFFVCTHTSRTDIGTDTITHDVNKFHTSLKIKSWIFKEKITKFTEKKVKIGFSVLFQNKLECLIFNDVEIVSLPPVQIL